MGLLPQLLGSLRPAFTHPQVYDLYPNQLRSIPVCLLAATYSSLLPVACPSSSLQMYGLYPDQLPLELQVELQEAATLFPTVLQGAVRSGCTHLTASLLVTGEEAAALEKADGAAIALSRLLRSWKGGAGRPPWRLPPQLPLLRVVAQVETASAALLLQPLQAAGDGGRGRLLAPRGGAICPLSPSAADEQLQLTLAGPPATTIGAAHGLFRLRCADWQQLLLAGGQPEAAGAAAAAVPGGARRVLHCRTRGQHVAVSLLWPGQAELDGDDEESSESPSPHTPIVRNSRNTPARDDERLEAVAAALQQPPGAAAAEQQPASAEQQQQQQQQPAAAEAAPAAAAALEEQDGFGEGSEAGSPAASEPASDSEAEAAEEALTLRLLRSASSAEAWVPQALRQWGLYEFELAQGAHFMAACAAAVFEGCFARFSSMWHLCSSSLSVASQCRWLLSAAASLWAFPVVCGAPGQRFWLMQQLVRLLACELAFTAHLLASHHLPPLPLSPASVQAHGWGPRSQCWCSPTAWRPLQRSYASWRQPRCATLASRHACCAC